MQQKATLSQIQARLEQAIALRDDAAETAQMLVLESISSGIKISAATQQGFTSRINGYHREVELLMKIERDLVANGRAAENDLRVLSGFDALESSAAVLPSPASSDAQMAPREAPRNEASAAPLPASGDVF